MLGHQREEDVVEDYCESRHAKCRRAHKQPTMILVKLATALKQVIQVFYMCRCVQVQRVC